MKTDEVHLIYDTWFATLWSDISILGPSHSLVMVCHFEIIVSGCYSLSHDRGYIYTMVLVLIEDLTLITCCCFLIDAACFMGRGVLRCSNLTWKMDTYIKLAKFQLS